MNLNTSAAGILTCLNSSMKS